MQHFHYETVKDRVGWAVWPKRGLFASYLECSGNVVQSQYDGLQ